MKRTGKETKTHRFSACITRLISRLKFLYLCRFFRFLSLRPRLLHLPTQCIELIVAQRIAILRIQIRKIAPSLHSKNRFSAPPGPVFLYLTNALRHSRVGLKRMSAESRCAVATPSRSTANIAVFRQSYKIIRKKCSANSNKCRNFVS